MCKILEERKISRASQREFYERDLQAMHELSDHVFDRFSSGWTQKNEDFFGVIQENIAYTEKLLREMDEPSLDAGLIIDEPAKDSRLGEGISEVQSIVDENRKQPKLDRFTSFQKFLMVSLAIVTATDLALVMYACLRRDAQNEGDSDIDQLPQAAKDTMRELLKTWRAAPDSDYWPKVANALDAGVIIDGQPRPYTIADQIYFMSFMITLNPLQQLWEWSPADAEANALKLKSFYDAKKKTTDLCRHVLDTTYKGRLLPRAVAATQVRTVLGLVAREQRLVKEQAA